MTSSFFLFYWLVYAINILFVYEMALIVTREDSRLCVRCALEKNRVASTRVYVTSPMKGTSDTRCDLVSYTIR